MKRLEHFGTVVERMSAGSTIVLHSGCAEPRFLAQNIVEYAEALKGVQLISFMPMGDAPYGAAAPASCLDVATFFPGRGLRSALTAGRVRPLRFPLSVMPALFDTKKMMADLLLIQTSPPDETGYVSLGISVDYMRSVLAQAPLVVAEINPDMPRTCGDTRVPVSSIDWFVDALERPQEILPAAADDIDEKIAYNVAGLIRDGAVLQVGIGALPECVVGQLGHLKHLGLHTGIMSDAIRPLLESGVIDNSTKNFLPGISVTTMAGGTQSFYDFLHCNKSIEFHPCSVTHSLKTLSGIDGLCAINSALQVDLAGNVNAEEMCGRKIALVGGLLDFATGATRSQGGVSIVALRSTFSKDGSSNIVVQLESNSPVSVPSSMVDFIVTEYGVASMRGVSEESRAHSLVAVAHPSHRENLSRELASLTFA